MFSKKTKRNNELKLDKFRSILKTDKYKMSVCAVCGVPLIKQEIGKDGMPNPQLEEPDPNLPEWKKKIWRERFRQERFPMIWSCPVHGTTPIH